VLLSTAVHAEAPASGTERVPQVRVDDAALSGLLQDVERIVASEDASGWFLDASALEAIHPTVMESACRAGRPVRLRALAVLSAEQAARGAPTVLFRSRGRRLTADVLAALQTEREIQALQLAEDGAAECPFWVTEGGFRGRQTYRERWVLSLETGGVAQVRQTESTWTLGGGGAGRLLTGYGFRAPVTVLGGFEFGGGAMLDPGTEPTQFLVNYFPAVPLVVRIHDVSWHYDFELAAVSLFQADDFELSYGGRVGFGIGVSALRTRGFIPWGGAALAYDHYFENGGRAAAHFVRAGLRVGAVYDP
jgi:hypothetical protein